MLSCVSVLWAFDVHSGAVFYPCELCFTVTSAVTATALQMEKPKPRVHYLRRGVCVHSVFVIKGGSYYSGDITDDR